MTFEHMLESSKQKDIDWHAHSPLYLLYASIIPQAKLQNGRSYSIITDHLGTPIMATDEEGLKVWQRILNTRGNPLQKTDNFVPFLYQGQYFDDETGLAYNRFRYYSPSEGTFINTESRILIGVVL